MNAGQILAFVENNFAALQVGAITAGALVVAVAVSGILRSIMSRRSGDHAALEPVAGASLKDKSPKGRKAKSKSGAGKTANTRYSLRYSGEDSGRRVFASSDRLGEATREVRACFGAADTSASLPPADEMLCAVCIHWSGARHVHVHDHPDGTSEVEINLGEESARCVSKTSPYAGKLVHFTDACDDGDYIDELKGRL